ERPWKDRNQKRGDEVPEGAASVERGREEPRERLFDQAVMRKLRVSANEGGKPRNHQREHDDDVSHSEDALQRTGASIDPEVNDEERRGNENAHGPFDENADPRERGRGCMPATVGDRAALGG